jgi:hypothetical protein
MNADTKFKEVKVRCGGLSDAGCGKEISVGPGAEPNTFFRIVLPVGPLKKLEPCYLCGGCWWSSDNARYRKNSEAPLSSPVVSQKRRGRPPNPKPVVYPVAAISALPEPEYKDSPRMAEMRAAVEKIPERAPRLGPGSERIAALEVDEAKMVDAIVNDLEKKILAPLGVGPVEAAKAELAKPEPVVLRAKTMSVKVPRSHPVYAFDAGKTRGALDDYSGRPDNGLSLKDIASKYGVPVGTVKTWVRRYKTSDAVPDAPLMGAQGSVQAYRKTIQIRGGFVEVEFRVNLLELVGAERALVFALVDVLRAHEERKALPAL